MRIILSLFSSFLLAQCSIGTAEDAAQLREKGIQALKESEANPARIVEAVRYFAKASDLYASAGNDAIATEMNSFLFWCKKKMTNQDIDQFLKTGDAAVIEKLNAVEKMAPKADEVQKWLERAEKFAKDNPNEHFLIAIRFNEVASRFLGTKESVAAQERSLKEQALSMEIASKTKPVLPDKTIHPVIGASDPIKQRVGMAKANYENEYESGRKAFLEAFDKREASARKEGNKSVVDKIKAERAAYEPNGKIVSIEAFTQEGKRKVEAAWRTLVAAYETGIKEYTKLAKDVDADAIAKEFEFSKAEHVKRLGYTSFAGIWELDKSKSELAAGPKIDAETWIVSQDEKTLSVETKVMLEGKDPHTQKRAFNLDGTEIATEMTFAQMSGRGTMKMTKLSEGNRTLETTFSFTGKRDNKDVTLTVKDKWELADEGKTLKISRKREGVPNPVETKMVFTKK